MYANIYFLLKKVLLNMLIERNKVNTCIFTLAEKTTLGPVYYLFELICVSDNGTTNVTFLANDISNNKLRYNEFQIEETSNVDRTIGKINLPIVGNWTYNIYEQSSSSNLDVTLTGNLVEFGKVDVTESVEEQATFETTQTIKIFNG